jgi:hypothetical protein
VPNACPCDDLFDRYIEHAQRQGARRRAVEVSIGIFLKKYVGPDLTSRRMTYPIPGRGQENNADEPQFERGPCYVFPPLAECRERFAQELQQEIRWGDGNLQWGNDIRDGDEEEAM